MLTAEFVRVIGRGLEVKLGLVGGKTALGRSMLRPYIQFALVAQSDN